MSSELEIDYIAYELLVGENLTYNAPYLKTNFPASWVRQYWVMNYIAINPVSQAGFSQDKPSFWSDLDWSDPKLASYLKDAADHGLPRLGYLIPLTDTYKRKALMTFSSHSSTKQWNEKIGKLSACLIKCSQILHRKAMEELFCSTDDATALSPREIECLSWSARGKNAHSISQKLGISVHTVRDYLKSAKHKLSCGNLAQAIHKITTRGLLN